MGIGMGLGIPDMTAVVDGVHVMGRDNRGPEAHHRITQRFGGYHLRDSIKDVRISKLGGLSALAGSTKSGDGGMVVGGGIGYWLGRRMTGIKIATTTARAGRPRPQGEDWIATGGPVARGPIGGGHPLGSHAAATASTVCQGAKCTCCT